MPSPEITTNYRTSDGVDLGKKLVSKDYLISVYPQIANQIITPELWVWGATSNGALGNSIGGTTGARCTPITTLAGGANWKQVSSGYRIMAAIKNDGTLWTWGKNSNGELGDSTKTTRSTPVTTFIGGTNWKQVSCGVDHIGAIKTDGTLWMWGSNSVGQIGDNTRTTRCTPVTTFAGGTNWKQVSSGSKNCAAIKTDGTLWTWGQNTYGQLGDSTSTTRCTPVTTFAGGTNWKQVSCGYHCAAIKTDGTLWSWGKNTAGELGINVQALSSNRLTPVTTFAGGTNWKQVSCGYQITAVIKTSDDLQGI